MFSRLVICFMLISFVCCQFDNNFVDEYDDGNCGKCDKNVCPTSSNDCPSGLVEDLCGCCELGVCGNWFGEKCFDRTLENELPKSARKYGFCGQNMDCVLRKDLRPEDLPEALCMCHDQKMACGTDNHTYESICEMEKLSALTLKEPVWLKHWGPCRSVPWPVSSPKDIVVEIGQSFGLDCEVKGYPVPFITWEFIADNSTHKMLPGDDVYVAIQTRGGPEPFMSTSWIQIISMRPSDQGTYFCVATNSEGVSRVSATVKIGRN